MAKFQKGNSGRPLGAKNKSYLNLNYWFELLHEDAATLSIAQRFKYIALAIQTLAPKLQSLPASPEDSVKNADETMKLIEALENEPRA